MKKSVCVASLTILMCLPSIAFAQLRAEVVGSGFANPVNAVQDPAIPGVFYVVEQGGVVRIIRDGVVLPDPFIDLRGSITSGGERGLLGMAFPPDAATSGRVFFNFTDQNGDTVVARFTRNAANPLAVDPSSRFDLRWSTGLRVIQQPFANHNGGHLVFGPDGFLYIATGDGGSARDPQNNAQNPGTLLGKVLRIDVNVPDSDPDGFRVPADNPFLDGIPILAMPEIWDFGMRNPWRYSFDDFGPSATNALIIADVGQNAREEINFEPAGAGGRNYGWRIREGRIPTPGVPPTAPAFGPLTDPIYDYTHDEGSSVTGGFIYRGQALGASYLGRYFFADFVSSRVWSLGLRFDESTGDAIGTDVIEHTAELGGSAFLGGISSFARDSQGELYLTTFAGRVLRLGRVGAPPNAPRDLRIVVSGRDVVVTWNAPEDGAVPLAYQLEAGSVPGAADLAVVFAEANQFLLPFAGVPPGTYYVRVRGFNEAGLGAASTELTVVVPAGGCTAAPPAPFGFASIVDGRTVRLFWALPSTSNGPTSFVLDAGSAPGVTDIVSASLPANIRSLTVDAPPGNYYARIRAVNACGSSAVSNEILVTVF
jgi:glucose/arabinose dehydrogenase